MPICHRLIETLTWPGVVLLYGIAGAGKTTLSLEFVRDYCRTRCLFVTTEGLEFIQRAEQMGIDTTRMIVYEALWYTDLLDLLTRKDIPLYDIMVIDSINSFIRIDAENSYRMVLLLAASLYKVSEDYGVPIIETAQVHSNGEQQYEPVAGRRLSLWTHNVIRLDYVSPGHRRLLVEKPSDTRLELELRISDGGIEWLNC